MYAKISTVVVALAAFVAAMPTPGGSSQCNTGPIQCCNSVQSADSAAASTLLGLLGVALEGITGNIGINCVPVLSNSCTAEPVCCENNNYNGLVNIGCSPVSL